MVIVILSALLGAVLYVWLVQSAYRGRAQLDKSVFQLGAEAIHLDKSAEEIVRLRALPPMRQQPSRQSDFRALMQANVNAAGLSRSLLSIEPLDADQVKVTFGAVPFADWLAWVETLRSQQIRLDTARIEALATLGLASATATFVRPRP
jgi:type II secretory pathway component PulM